MSRVVHSFARRPSVSPLRERTTAGNSAGYLERESLRYEFIKIQGAVRENLTLRCDGQTIKLNRKGRRSPK